MVRCQWGVKSCQCPSETAPDDTVVGDGDGGLVVDGIGRDGEFCCPLLGVFTSEASG